MFRTTAELVVVPAVVFSSDGGPVVDLTVEDFKITEQGRERPISVFSRPDSGPLEVALVIDSSDSMNRWPPQQAIIALLDSLDSGSCVLLLPFDERVRTGVWGHPDDQFLRATVAGLRLYGRTATYDALLAAFDLMRTRRATQDQAQAPSGDGHEGFSFGDLMRFRTPGPIPGPGVERPVGNCTVGGGPVSPTDPAPNVRRAIVVTSDGHDNESQATIEDVLLSAWGSRLPVFGFAVTQPLRPLEIGVRSRPSSWLAHFRALQRVAQYSGGIVIRATVYESGRQFVDAFERLGAALRSHYVLGYVPAKGHDGDTWLDRRSIQVSVRRPGFDVLAPSDLVLGRGASEGAALDLALRGFHQLAMGQSVAALGNFDVAAAFGPRLGLAHFGRGISLSLLAQPKDALAALRTAEDLAPWLPDLDARVAELLVRVGDFDAAWQRALRAYRDGSGVLDLIGRLQQLAPRRIDLSRLALGRRIGLQANVRGSLLASFAIPPLLGALGKAIQESEQISLGTGRSAIRTVLQVEVTKARRRGARIVSIEGRMTLQNEDGKALENEGGEKLLVRSFKLRNAASDEEVRSTAAAVVAEIEELLETR